MAGADYLEFLLGPNGKTMEPQAIADKNGCAVQVVKTQVFLTHPRHPEFNVQLSEGTLHFGRFQVKAKQLGGDQAAVGMFLESEGDLYAGIGCYGFWGDDHKGVSPATKGAMMDWLGGL
jgi:hypothetical protein